MKKTFAVPLLLILLALAFPALAQTSADLDGDNSIDPEDLFLFQRLWSQNVQNSTQPGLSRTSFADGYQEPALDMVPSVTPYSLPVNSARVRNWDLVNSYFYLAQVKETIEANGFGVLASSTGEDVINPYVLLEDLEIPIFITADSLLHLYHVQFDETLKEIEEREFFGILSSLTEALVEDASRQLAFYRGEGRLEEAARRNLAYFSVALRLLDETADLPESATGWVDDELQLIDAHGGFSKSPIFVYEEDYSQYVPRGHYTRSETLEKYFKAMMWYGRIGFLLRNIDPVLDVSASISLPPPNAEIQTLGACLIADALQRVDVEGAKAFDLWDRVYAVTAFYVGVADDLTPSEYLQAVREVLGSAADLRDLTDPVNYEALRAYLAGLRNPEIYGGTGNCILLPPFDPNQIDACLELSKGLRFMGQRFVPDSYMFQNLVSADYIGQGTPFTLVISRAGRPIRGFPRGLDVMDLLGSQRAYEILVAEGDTVYQQYPQHRQDLIDEFSAFSTADWNRNLYWGWLYVLRSLLQPYGAGYPTFMQTQAWTDKSLNAALASWTELRHDTILYAKPSYTPGTFGGPRPPCGYVEPVPDFYARLLALVNMTGTGLSALDVLSEEAQTRLDNLADILQELLRLSIMELENEPFDDSDGAFIERIGRSLERTVLGVINAGVKTTLIADVHTEANTGQVLEEAVGYVDLLAVVIPQPDGSLALALGPVFSYFEFKWPMSDRMTDEAWREKLAEDPPARPPWTSSFVGARD